MAFNFNWSPLTADADFYQRAQDLLTKALNKSPKPPIIVDDILVSELNLGTVPPELEILEIGDLAEDRFRGIFKMCYSGDAFLTLKTRVQANPLNTYLCSKPSFTSPQPLAASSGLTIPLSITLSEIKLSAFIILVFSKQKGLTLVFRNDPLESLKVSSTFDSIQFVRDYLQRTIEAQLRNLMMDELPAIIHRLSLQLWCPDQLPKEEKDVPKESPEDDAVDPLASPPLDAVDSSGHRLDEQEISSLALYGGPEYHSLFSQKNLVRLATLTDCHRNLSLFNPGIQDVIFRAWMGPMERSEATLSPLHPTPSLVRSHSYHGSATTYTFSDTGSQTHGHLPSRPSLVSLASASAGISLGSGRSKSYASRKKKKRVVNLRRIKTEAGTSSETEAFTPDTASAQRPATESLVSTSIPEEPEEAVVSPMASPTKVRFTPGGDMSCLPTRPPLMKDHYPVPAEETTDAAMPAQSDAKPAPAFGGSVDTKSPAHYGMSLGPGSDRPPVALDQAWIMKMAGEIARRVYDEKNRHGELWDDREDVPPPAYEAS